MKIKLDILYYILLIFPFIKPNYIIHIDSLNKVYNAFQIINFIIILVVFVKKSKINLQLFLIIILQAILIFSTVINNGEIIDVITNSIQIFAFSLIIEYLTQKNINLFFKAISIILIVLVVLNYITILIQPDGYLIGYLKKWLFGTKNNHFSIILPAIICSYIYFKFIKKCNSVIFKILLVVSIASVIFLQSATTLVAMFVLLLYFPLKNIIKKINIKNFFVIYCIIFFVIIVFQLQNIFSFFIEDVLNKDVTFTGRTELWNTSLEFIKDKPLLGYGNENQDNRVVKFGKLSYIHCHNMILEILYQGGIILLIVFIIFLYNVIKKISITQNNDLKSLGLWTLIVYSIALFTEVYSFEVLLWMLLVLSNINRIKFLDEEIYNE